MPSDPGSGGASDNLVDPPDKPSPHGPTRLFPQAVVRGYVGTAEPGRAMDEIRRTILAWLQNRAGRLPPEAWSFGPFTVDLGGTLAEVARAETAEGELWAARLRYPDENTAGRVWRVETTLARTGRELRFGAKLDLAAREEDPVVELSVPRIVRFVVDNYGLRAGASRLATRPQRWTDGKALAEHLSNADRLVPALVFSLAGTTATPWRELIDPERLAARLAGVAEVHLVSVRAAFELSDALGKVWSCFNGAVRLYRAAFRPAVDSPARHPLFLPDRISAWMFENDVPFEVQLGRLVGRESLGRAPAGFEVPTFARIQERQREARLAAARSAGETAERLLALAEEEIRALRQRLDEAEGERARREIEFDELLSEAERERGEALAELAAARARIALLEERLRQARVEFDAEVPDLGSYSELGAWAERHLAGRLVLLPRAIRAAKEGLFEDVALVGRALLYLAGPYRQLRIEGRERAGAAHDRALAELGLANQSVGEDLTYHRDRFRVEWRGNKRLLDLHVKNGGNTRDPRRCLRIYYFWDEAEQLVVVGSLPGHIRTGAT